MGRTADTDITIPGFTGKRGCGVAGLESYDASSGLWGSQHVVAINGISTRNADKRILKETSRFFITHSFTVKIHRRFGFVKSSR
jgi:hypothetical protein